MGTQPKRCSRALRSAFESLHDAACAVEASHWEALIEVPRLALASEPSEWRNAPAASVERFLNELARARKILHYSMREPRNRSTREERALVAVGEAHDAMLAAYKGLLVALAEEVFGVPPPPLPALNALGGSA